VFVSFDGELLLAVDDRLKLVAGFVIQSSKSFLVITII
jgi:hypothetical protein